MCGVLTDMTGQAWGNIAMAWGGHLSMVAYAVKDANPPAIHLNSPDLLQASADPPHTFPASSIPSRISSNVRVFVRSAVIHSSTPVSPAFSRLQTWPP